MHTMLSIKLRLLEESDWSLHYGVCWFVCLRQIDILCLLGGSVLD